MTALNEKGIPTPLAATMLRAPMSRMDILSDDEINSIIAKSKLAKKYNETIDRESAYEILVAKIKEAQVMVEKEVKKTATSRRDSTSDTVTKGVVKVLTSATFIRGVMGVLMRILKK